MFFCIEFAALVEPECWHIYFVNLVNAAKLGFFFLSMFCFCSFLYVVFMCVHFYNFFLFEWLIIQSFSVFFSSSSQFIYINRIQNRERKKYVKENHNGFRVDVCLNNVFNASKKRKKKNDAYICKFFFFFIRLVKRTRSRI